MCRVWGNRLGSRPALALLGSIVASTVAAAAPADVAREWGLLGRWSLDCAMPVRIGQGNSISYEVAADGRLIYRRDDNSQDSNEIVEARVGDSRTLILRIVMPKFHQTRENAVAMATDGTIHAVYSRGEDGSYTIRDGMFVSNGKPTPSLRRCR